MADEVFGEKLVEHGEISLPETFLGKSAYEFGIFTHGSPSIRVVCPVPGLTERSGHPEEQDANARSELTPSHQIPISPDGSSLIRPANCSGRPLHQSAARPAVMSGHEPAK